MPKDTDSTSSVFKQEIVGNNTITVEYRRCATCKVFNMPANYSAYKNCVSCRRLSREKSRKSLERRKEREKRLLETLIKVKQDSDDKKENVVSTTHEHTKQHSKPLRDLEGEEGQREALTMMKDHLNAAVKGANRVNSAGAHIEYQTASSLYDALKTVILTNTPKKFQFQGSHSIVAVPSINNEKRATLVSSDLRKLARLQFEHKSPTSTISQPELQMTSYKCTCLDSAPTASISDPSTVVKGNKGNLVHWARAQKAVSATVQVECNGVVKITVHDDTSHIHGIPGQRIVVVVDHTKK